MEDTIKTYYRAISIIEDKIIALNKEKNSIYSKLSSLRKQKEDNNKHLIGKEATIYYQEREYKCKCIGIKCLNDFTLKPFFDKFGKLDEIDYYEWDKE